MSLQSRSFDSRSNPFLKAANPYRIQQKIHTQTSSQQKYKKDYFSKHLYNSTCNHCVKNVPLLEELNKRSTFLRAEKQNLHKMSSARLKNTKIGMNPFQKKRLMGQNQSTANNSYTQYSRQDQSKLRDLLWNNPFKKYHQQKQNIDKNKQFDVQFHNINLVRLTPNQKFQFQKNENTSRWISSHHNRQSSARFSIDSLNNNRDKINYLQGSPNKKSKFSPTVGDIASFRENCSRKSIKEISLNEHKTPCLIKQINQSRKNLFEYSKLENQSPYHIPSNSSTRIPPKSPSKQPKPQNIKTPQFIIVRGNKFFLNQVKFKY